MGNIEKKLLSLGLVLPPPVKPPAGVVLPFQFIRLVGNRGYISGHGPQNPDGSISIVSDLLTCLDVSSKG